MVSIIPRVDLLGNTVVDWICKLSYFRLDTLNHVFTNSSAVLENADFEQISNEHLELVGGLGPKRRFSHYSGLKFGGMVRYRHTYMRAEKLADFYFGGLKAYRLTAKFSGGMRVRNFGCC